MSLSRCLDIFLGSSLWELELLLKHNKIFRCWRKSGCSIVSKSILSLINECICMQCNKMQQCKCVPPSCLPLSVFLSVSISACLSLSMSLRLSLSLSFSLSICLSLSACLFCYLSLSVCLSLSLSVCLSISLFPT